MQASMELLVIKGGVLTPILAQPFQRYSKWVMQSWLKSVWEKVSMFNLRVEVQELPLKMPCKHDNWILLIFKSTGYSNDELVRLNRVCCYQHVPFYSDILDQRARTLVKIPRYRQWPDHCYLAPMQRQHHQQCRPGAHQAPVNNLSILLPPILLFFILRLFTQSSPW
jgi:hypothetical protein